MKDISNLLSQAWGYENYFILNFFSLYDCVSHSTLLKELRITK